MKYRDIHRAIFLARPNRFIAHAVLGGETVICHVKNTGRCKELLVPGCTVYLEESDNPARKTKYDLVAVEKGTGGTDCRGPAGLAMTGEGPGTPISPAGVIANRCAYRRGNPSPSMPRLVNMDAQAPNAVFGEWAAAGHFVPGLTLLRPETTFGKSRFDFYWEAEDGGDGGQPATPLKKHSPVGAAIGRPNPARRGFVEVKGVTLEVDGGVYFPDAPTERGVKHIRELMTCQEAGYEAALCFVIQMAGVTHFSPNDATHPAFGTALREAAAAGVRILAYDCDVTADSLKMGREVEVVL